MRAAVAALVSLGLVAACGEDAAAPSANTVSVPEPATTVVVDGGVLDGSWRAVGATVDGVDVGDLDTVVVTLEVSGGSASGSSGCNSYVRPVTVSDGSIEFGPGEVSEAGCSGPIGEIEGQFRQSTSGVVEWSIVDGVLTLTTSTSVWVFDRTGAAPAPTTLVTTTPATNPPAAEPAASAVEVRPVGGCFPADGEGPAPDTATNAPCRRRPNVTE
jgi:heat shock protein HslJ